MSTFGRLGLLLSGFCFIVMAGARSILGIWHPVLYGFLLFFFLGFIISLILDYKFYLEFFSMKTTKNGLSLGWSLILLIVFLTAFSYFSHRFNKTFDLTEEGINSLAKQTTDILSTLEKEVKIYIFYKGDKISQTTATIKQQAKEALSLYKQESSKIKVFYVDTYKDNLLAEEYLKDLPDRNQKEIFLFVSYDGRRVRVEDPYNEEKLSSAIIKVRKRTSKEIYFLVGHGERDLKNDQPSGLKIFNQYLKDSGFTLREWSFIQDGIPQTRPSLVLVAGPRRPFLTEELGWIKKYLLEQNGKVIFALDPKEKHNLQGFLKDFGVSFNNDFIVSQIGLLYGGYTKALGSVFSDSSPITKRFNESRKNFVLFDKASSVSVSQKDFKNFKQSYLVKSYNKSFSVPELTDQAVAKNFKSLGMAVEVKSLPKKDLSSDGDGAEAELVVTKNKESNLLKDKVSNLLGNNKELNSTDPDKQDGFRLIVFGDSDFFSNRYFYDGSNKDLALNSIVSLVGENELITIRPKQAKGTKITLTRFHKVGFLFVMLALPLMFLIASLFLWYRRREA